MKRRLPLALSMLLIAAVSSVLTYSALAQLVTRTVGTPKCNAFNDRQGNHCYEIKCNASPDDYSNYKTCDGKPIDTSLLGVQLCEIVPSTGREIDRGISCRTVNDPGSSSNSISYTWITHDGIHETSEATMTCPHSCQKCAVEPNGLGLCPRVP